MHNPNFNDKMIRASPWEIDEKMSVLYTNANIQIREVWRNNLEKEFGLIRGIVDTHPYIAMDTEFPGVVVALLRDFGNNILEKTYHNLRANVNLLKLIQLGLTFSDEEGTLPKSKTGKYCVWQFNFREFNPNVDICAQDSIDLLRRSGIDLEKNNAEGVDVKRFAQLMRSSGIVSNDSFHWVTFHGGYDVGYLLRLLTGLDLPETREEFLELVQAFFPNIYDVKDLMRFGENLRGGLNKLALKLRVERVGRSHQAGSDSLLTSCTFFKLKRDVFNGSVERRAGVLYGLHFQN
ncbi:hypothetical protein DH2020_010851 [Rehmannia glutinosa]|uniref:poly(A)-specific ribonuclease n=1 Tax=Rehmannia glutinosa TaxID=99300 RepID=A0ABR0XBR8_REHGL